MKRFIMFALPILLVIGFANAQQVSNWKQTQLTWSSIATQTILTGETKFTDAIVLSETIFGSTISKAGVVEHSKFPSKLSFQIKAVENTGDSSNVIHTLQFSGDGTNFYDFVAIDTSLSITGANGTEVDFTVLTDANFPDIQSIRVKSFFATGITDTVDLSGYVSEKFTQ